MGRNAPRATVVIEHDTISLLQDGSQAFPAMLSAIAGAKQTICLETYILKDDRTGRRFGTALCERARAGVEVLVLYDAWGSKVSEEWLAELAAAGVKARPFRPAILKGSLGRLYAHLMKRNHRKSLVVDGRVGFTGGLNISDDYAAVPDGGHGWRDTHVRIEGPSAQELERLFLSTWRLGRRPQPDWQRFSRGQQGKNSALRIVGNDFARDRKDIRKVYLEAFSTAKTSILLTHAYFMPPTRLLRPLEKAARRGVNVQLIIAASTDVKMLLYAARGLYPRLLRAGVTIHEWEGRVLHAKTMVVDGQWTTIGSSNLDSLSLRQNLEVNAVMHSAELAQAAEALFEEDLRSTTLVTRETVRGYGLLERALQWFATRFRRWL